MQSYVGSWSGKYTVHSTATGFTEAFEVRQQYWLDDDKLYGASVVLREGSKESASSITVIQGKSYYSIVNRGLTQEEYIGVPRMVVFCCPAI